MSAVDSQAAIPRRVQTPGVEYSYLEIDLVTLVESIADIIDVYQTWQMSCLGCTGKDTDQIQKEEAPNERS